MNLDNFVFKKIKFNVFITSPFQEQDLIINPWTNEIIFNYYPLGKNKSLNQWIKFTNDNLDIVFPFLDQLSHNNKKFFIKMLKFGIKKIKEGHLNLFCGEKFNNLINTILSFIL